MRTVYGVVTGLILMTAVAAHAQSSGRAAEAEILAMDQKVADAVVAGDVA